jgi:Zinc knuckle
LIMDHEGGPSSGEQDVLGNINRRFDELAAQIASQAQELTQARNENRLLKEELVNSRRTRPTASSLGGAATPLSDTELPRTYSPREKIKLPIYNGEPAR